MTNIGSLAYKVVVDTRQATEGLVITRREMRAAKAITESLATPMEKYGAQLEVIRDLLNKNAISVETYRRAEQALKDELPEAIAAREKQAEEEKKRAALVSQAIALNDKYATAEEKHAKELKRLNDLMQTGALSQEAYNAAVKEAEKQLPETTAEVERLAKAEKEHADVLARGKAMTEQYRTPMEVYRNNMAELNHLHKSGAIDQQTFQRAQWGMRREMVAGIPVIGGVTSGLMGLSPVTAAVGVALAGATVIVGGFVAAIKISSEAILEQIDRIDQLNDAAAKIGIGVEAYTKLGFAAKMSGVEQAAVEAGLVKLQAGVGKAALGAEAYREVFAKLNLDFRELIALSPEKQFELVAEAIAGMPTHAERTAAAMEIFGKQGAGLVPLLEGGAEGLRQSAVEAERLGIAITDVDAAAIGVLNDEFDKLSLQMEGLWAQMATDLAPTMSVLVKDFSEMYGVLKQTGAVEAFGKALQEGMIYSAAVIHSVYGGILLLQKAVSAASLGILQTKRAGMALSMQDTSAIDSEIAAEKDRSAMLSDQLSKVDMSASGVGYMEFRKKILDGAAATREEIAASVASREAQSAEANRTRAMQLAQEDLGTAAEMAADSATAITPTEPKRVRAAPDDAAVITDRAEVIKILEDIRTNTGKQMPAINLRVANGDRA